MQTPIHLTRKLEKLVSKYISQEQRHENEFLGKWNATVFYVSRRKCWMLLHRDTRYLVLLPDIRQADMKNISKIFKNAFYDQLKYDGIDVDYSLIDKIVGEIQFFGTDNDRSANGSLNRSLYIFDYWSNEFGHFDNMPFSDLTNRLNSTHNEILKWERPLDVMAALLDKFVE